MTVPAKRGCKRPPCSPERAPAPSWLRGSPFTSSECPSGLLPCVGAGAAGAYLERAQDCARQLLSVGFCALRDGAAETQRPRGCHCTRQHLAALASRHRSLRPHQGPRGLAGLRQTCVAVYDLSTLRVSFPIVYVLRILGVDAVGQKAEGQLRGAFVSRRCDQASLWLLASDP